MIPAPLTAVALVAALLGRTPGLTARAAACERLADLKLSHATITSAEAITSGSLALAGPGRPATSVPPFCRVIGVAAPTSDSHIAFEVWLPLENWNHRLTGVGNGGFAGSVNLGALVTQIRRGDASLSTDTGHEAVDGADMAKFAFGHPEKLVDFAYRSVHETTEQAKTIVRAFYGAPAAHAYWIGCSSGGYQGLMEAQRFPDDYDGIVAGAPANNFTRLMAGDLENVLALVKGAESALPRAKLRVLHAGVLALCDAMDGVVDSMLTDPRRCAFDPATLRCRADQDPANCLTAGEVEAARRVYAGLRNSTTGARIYPGLPVGSEPAWLPLVNPASPFAIPIAYYQWIAFDDPAWDWRTFDWTNPADFQKFLTSETKFAPILNATNPDLRAFQRRGGKLIQYHGWADQLISAQNSIDYYESVVATLGTAGDRAAALREVQSYYRLMMAPGMFHCAGGPGPNTFDMQTAIEKWVEQGTAPEAVIATRVANGTVLRSRPLCVYPKVAMWKGQGSTNEEANFECRAAKP
jgi:feruloyl esterase